MARKRPIEVKPHTPSAGTARAEAGRSVPGPQRIRRRPGASHAAGPAAGQYAGRRAGWRRRHGRPRELLMARVELELSCNTQLRCTECGCQNFRICMDCNEEANEMSATVVNNVECSACHALYQVNLVRA
jgi:hypothetical protein